MPKFLQNSLYALFICITLVIICYFFIDKPIAFWAYHAQLRQINGLHEAQQLSEIFFVLVPLIYIYIFLRFCYGKHNYHDHALMLCAHAYVITTAMKSVFKFIFGRYWPMTFVNDNPSLIEDGAYGFNYFHLGSAYQSFPSGHTAVIFTGATVVWLLYPRLRWLSVIACALVVIGLIANYYHFVSDIIAGAFLGIIVAVSLVKFSRVPGRLKA